MVRLDYGDLAELNLIYDILLTEFMERKLIGLKNEYPSPPLSGADVSRIFSLLGEKNMIDLRERAEHAKKASAVQKTKQSLIANLINKKTTSFLNSLKKQVVSGEWNRVSQRPHGTHKVQNPVKTIMVAASGLEPPTPRV